MTQSQGKQGRHLPRRYFDLLTNEKVCTHITPPSVHESQHIRSPVCPLCQRKSLRHMNTIGTLRPILASINGTRKNLYTLANGRSSYHQRALGMKEINIRIKLGAKETKWLFVAAATAAAAEVAQRGSFLNSIFLCLPTMTTMMMMMIIIAIQVLTLDFTKRKLAGTHTVAKRLSTRVCVPVPMYRLYNCRNCWKESVWPSLLVPRHVLRSQQKKQQIDSCL